MPKNTDNKTATCPVESTLQVIGGKWKVMIIHFLLEHERRFGELARCLGRISPRTLAQQLKELEADGIVTRTDYEEKPQRVEYSISEFGKTLAPILYAMGDWGQTLETRHQKSS